MEKVKFLTKTICFLSITQKYNLVCFSLKVYSLNSSFQDSLFFTFISTPAVTSYHYLTPLAYHWQQTRPVCIQLCHLLSQPVLNIFNSTLYPFIPNICFLFVCVCVFVWVFSAPFKIFTWRSFPFWNLLIFLCPIPIKLWKPISLILMCLLTLPSSFGYFQFQNT